MTEDAIQVRLDALQRSVDQGFGQMNKRLDTVESDVKGLREEGLPRRVGRLEKWRDALAGRVWVLIIGGVLAVAGSWAAVVFNSGVI